MVYSFFFVDVTVDRTVASAFYINLLLRYNSLIKSLTPNSANAFHCTSISLSFSIRLHWSCMVTRGECAIDSMPVMGDRWSIECYFRINSKTHWTDPEIHLDNEILVFLPSFLLRFFYYILFIRSISSGFSLLCKEIFICCCRSNWFKCIKINLSTGFSSVFHVH